MSASATIESAETDRVGAQSGSSDPQVHEYRGRAMGTRLHVLVVGDPALVDFAVKRVDQLESRWSRFIDNSEISRCNNTRGIPVDVSTDTRNLVRHAIHGWTETAGAYDPTVLDSLIASGYDRSYEILLEEGADASLIDDAVPAPGCDGIEINDEFGTVTLPLNTGFDPGGIGKGLAADMLVEELMAAGANGAMVNLGGDLRVAGAAPTPDHWVVEVEEPTVKDGRIALTVMIDGGLATSTTRRRVWTVGGRQCNHVIDPRIGRPVESEAQLATVISGRAWWSEVLATQLLLTPADRWEEVTGDAASLIIDSDGNTHTFGSMKDHLR